MEGEELIYSSFSACQKWRAGSVTEYFLPVLNSHTYYPEKHAIVKDLTNNHKTSTRPTALGRIQAMYQYRIWSFLNEEIQETHVWLSAFTQDTVKKEEFKTSFKEKNVVFHTQVTN